MNLLSLHLPLDIAGRVPRGSEKFSLAFGLSMAVVAVAAPFLGHLADRAGKRRFLVPFVLAGVAFTALVAAPGPVPRVLVFFAFANIAFQCAYVFYNALLPDVSDETNSGRVSGFGVAAGYLGSLLGMFLVLPFVSAAIRLRMPHVLLPVIDALSVAPLSSNLNEAWVRRNAYLPTALLWLAAAVPLLFLARLPKVVRVGEAARAPEIGENEEKEKEKEISAKEAGGGAPGAEASHDALLSKKSFSSSSSSSSLSAAFSTRSAPSPRRPLFSGSSFRTSSTSTSSTRSRSRCRRTPATLWA